MRGLTDEQRRALLPGPEGEWASDETLTELIDDGRAAWVPEGDVHVFEPTPAGFLALTCDAAARSADLPPL